MVSLIVPCYNGERFIERCLDSILNQSDNNIELILVNDGSTDHTADIVQRKRLELESLLAKFIYLEQDNQGVGAACNNAFKKVTGQYLTLLDADDVMMPDSILERRKYLDEHSEYGLVRTNGYYVTEENSNVYDRLFEVNDYMKVKTDIFDDLFDGATYLWPGSYMIRMDILRKLYPNREIYPSRYGQNLQFVMMAAYISKAGFIDKPLMKYFVQEDSLSHFSQGDVLAKKINAMEGYKDIRRHLVSVFMESDEQNKWNKRIEKLYAGIYLDLAVEYKDKMLAKENYEKIRHLCDSAPDLKYQLAYYKLMNPLVYYILRGIRKLKLLK